MYDTRRRNSLLGVYQMEACQKTTLLSNSFEENDAYKHTSWMIVKASFTANGMTPGDL